MSFPRNHHGLHTYSLLLVLSIFICGCVSLPDPEVSQVSPSEVVGIVNSGHTFNQTFEIRRNGFNSISIWLGADTEDTANNIQDVHSVQIDLYSHTGSYILIHHTTVNVRNSLESQSINITFPPQEDSSGKIYSLQFSTDSGSICIFGRNENIYPNGQSFIDTTPIEADIAFSTTYKYDWNSFRHDISDWLKNTYLFPSFIIVLFLPGWLFLKTIQDQHTFDFGEKTGISMGISLAILPVILLWTSTIGISVTRTILLIFSGFLISIWIILVIRYDYINQIINGFKKLLQKIKGSELSIHLSILCKPSSTLVTTLSLLIIMTISLAVRLIMVRDLATPAWVDSVHHALITRIISDTGALPETYAPYLNLAATDYHPGFHSQLALFQLISDLDIPTTMLLFGQVINALMVFSIYALAINLTNSRITALFAALITGLFTPMPAYYTSWGRYTQLSGLIILPIAYILYTKAMNSIKKPKGYTCYALFIVAITVSGLFLVHYRVTAFFILLIISEFLISFINSGVNKSFIKRRLFLVTIFSLLVVILLFPWLIQALPNTFIPSLLRPVPNETKWFADFSWRYLTAASGKSALVIGGLGLIWGLFQKKRFAYLLSLWIGLLLILANMKVLGLPGGGLINTTSIEISLFIPISIFGGYFISDVINHWKSIIPSRIHSLLYIVTFITAIFITLSAAQKITTILNPITILSRESDLTAIQWIDENISSDMSILINPFPWGYGIFAGNDGGSWITPLTGLKTIPPPVLYGFSQKDDRELINQISQFAIDNGTNAADLHRYLKSNDINYVYSGARGGPISPWALSNYSGFKSIYENQGVWVFEVLP